MILILCEDSDCSALWAADALHTRGLSPIVLSDSDLAMVRGWRHTVGAEGVDFELHLQSGYRVNGREVRGVLNRLAFLPRAWASRIGGADKDYAVQEMQAFYLSWLHALPGKSLNPPSPQGLCGNFRHPSAWTALACRAGLPVSRFRQTCRDDPTAFWQTPMEPDAALVLVLGQKVFGPDFLVRSHRRACLQLALDSGCPLLGIRFEYRPDGIWRFSGATLLPDLRPGGDALADALAEELS